MVRRRERRRRRQRYRLGTRRDSARIRQWMTCISPLRIFVFRRSTLYNYRRSQPQTIVFFDSLLRALLLAFSRTKVNSQSFCAGSYTRSVTLLWNEKNDECRGVGRELCRLVVDSWTCAGARVPACAHCCTCDTDLKAVHRRTYKRWSVRQNNFFSFPGESDFTNFCPLHRNPWPPFEICCLSLIDNLSCMKKKGIGGIAMIRIFGRNRSSEPIIVTSHRDWWLKLLETSRKVGWFGAKSERA